MIFICDDIIEIISENLCIFDYSNICKFMLINKSFYKYINFYLDIFNNTNETILMATKIKKWRSEIDQSDYIYDSFILFDDISYYNYWYNITQCSDTYVTKEYKEIIKSNLYNTVMSSTLYTNKDEVTYNKINYNYINDNFYDKIKNNSEYKIEKLKFDTYFVYYFAEDISLCYAIHFLILPYYDSRMKNVKDFHSYNIVKKNQICNHNITNVYCIDF